MKAIGCAYTLVTSYKRAWCLIRGFMEEAHLTETLCFLASTLVLLSYLAMNLCVRHLRHREAGDTL
jgi:hypothetical protein